MNTISKNIYSGELFRNQINQWIVENLNELKNQREYDKFIKNKVFTFSFNSSIE